MDICTSSKNLSLYDSYPADVYFGRQESIFKQREKLKRKTMNKRRQYHNLQMLNVYPKFEYN